MSGIGNTVPGLETEEERQQTISALRKFSESTDFSLIKLRWTEHYLDKHHTEVMFSFRLRRSFSLVLEPVFL